MMISLVDAIGFRHMAQSNVNISNGTVTNRMGSRLVHNSDRNKSCHNGVEFSFKNIIHDRFYLKMGNSGKIIRKTNLSDIQVLLIGTYSLSCVSLVCLLTLMANHAIHQSAKHKMILRKWQVESIESFYEPCSTDQQCYICWDRYARGDFVRKLPCKHNFHAHCIDPWLSERIKTCPTCRKEVV